MAEADEDRAVPMGDFRIVKLDGMFHVVFRPDNDPEWFRIIASFFTYERAYQYADTEQVLTFEMETNTADEQKAGLRLPPVAPAPSAQVDADIPEMLRDIYDTKAPRVLRDDLVDQPDTELIRDGARFEAPADYHRRLIEQEISREADKQERRGPPAAPERETEFSVTLTEKQESVFRFFVSHANDQKLVNASIKQIATGAGVPQGSMAFLLESLEKKRLVEVVERGSPTRSGVFRLVAPDEVLQGQPA